MNFRGGKNASRRRNNFSGLWWWHFELMEQCNEEIARSIKTVSFFAFETSKHF
jgi:hypothetical protein